MSIERWKGVPGMEDKYEASTLGRIRNTRTGHILPYSRNRSNYYTVALWYDGKQCGTLAHLVVARTFLGKRPDGYHTRHLDGDKDNLRVDNLKYGTVLENMQDSYRLGRFAHPPMTQRKRRRIRQLLSEGRRQVDISKELGVSASTVCREKKLALRIAV